ncbi:hypothetical protein EB001_03690 [bacterium]|nr:hypothetical protein [bacterium]
MKKILLAVLLFATPALAKTNSIVCAFQDGYNFTVVEGGSTTMIQWGDKDFQPAKSNFEDPNLTVVQYANGNMFKVVWNVKTKEAWGFFTMSDGSKDVKPLFCAFK